VLGLDAMPATRSLVETAVRQLLLRKHPDKDPSSGATTRTQEILAARAHLVAKLA